MTDTSTEHPKNINISSSIGHDVQRRSLNTSPPGKGAFTNAVQLKEEGVHAIQIFVIRSCKYTRFGRERGSKKPSKFEHHSWMSP